MNTLFTLLPFVFMQVVLKFVYLGIATAVVSFLREHEHTLSAYSYVFPSPSMILARRWPCLTRWQLIQMHASVLNFQVSIVTPPIPVRAAKVLI